MGQRHAWVTYLSNFGTGRRHFKGKISWFGDGCKVSVHSKLNGTENRRSDVIFKPGNYLEILFLSYNFMDKAHY